VPLRRAAEQRRFDGRRTRGEYCGECCWEEAVCVERTCTGRACVMPIPPMHQPTPTSTFERPQDPPQGGVSALCIKADTPPGAPPRPCTRPRSPAQLTSFCPAPSTHLGKPANGSRGLEIQRSTSCNPRILQGRGMFGTWYLVVMYRGNGGIRRGIYQLQGDDNGHVGRPREVSPARPCPELLCELRGLCRRSYPGPRTCGRSN